MQLFAPFVVKNGKHVVPVIAVVLSVCLLVVLLTQTVWAQNTYVITDGDQVTVHTSYAENLDEVLNEAGIHLDENDFYTTQTTDAGSEITLQRAQTVTVDYCGQQLQLSTYGGTLEDLLKTNGLEYTGDYAASVAAETMTYDGMEVAIDKTIMNSETYTVEIPYDVVYCYDDTLPAGQEAVLVEGVAGQKRCTADVVYKNNQEIQRTVLEETVISEPSTQIVGMGTGERVDEEQTQPLIGDGVIVLPTGEVLTYTSSAQFLATAYTHFDAGCDMTTSTGTTVRHGVVAVDPTVIPYGTRMFIVTNDGYCVYGLSTAEDCGGDIKENRLDLYMDNLTDAFNFGRRNCTVYFLGDANWN